MKLAKTITVVFLFFFYQASIADEVADLEIKVEAAHRKMCKGRGDNARSAKEALDRGVTVNQMISAYKERGLSKGFIERTRIMLVDIDKNKLSEDAASSKYEKACLAKR